MSRLHSVSVPGSPTELHSVSPCLTQISVEAQNSSFYSAEKIPFQLHVLASGPRPAIQRIQLWLSSGYTSPLRSRG